MRQNDMILRDLMRGDVLTKLDALHRYQCFHLGGRIYEINRELEEMGSSLRVKCDMRKIASGKLVGHYYIPAELLLKDSQHQQQRLI